MHNLTALAAIQFSQVPCAVLNITGNLGRLSEFKTCRNTAIKRENTSTGNQWGNKNPSCKSFFFGLITISKIQVSKKT